ncbi:MAG: hypothetical protein JXB20_03055 [Bacilli bacterium]|nr:hypothetical protein [Bacilli bacterium]MBN2696060.1 hypothetical protein [Bacilli bacterium]
MRIKDYITPKSMIYTGKHKDISTKITHYQYSEDELLITEDFHPVENRKHYIQVLGLSDIAKIEALREHYKINYLILEDIFNVRQRNKLERTTDFLFGTFHIQYLEHGRIKSDYMSVLFNESTVISFHETEPVYLHPLIEMFQANEELRKLGTDYLFYLILDMITDNHLDIYDLLETKIDKFEEDLLESKKIDQENFYLVRKQILKLKSCVTPVMEELIEKLRLEKNLFKPETKNYYDDLCDHLQRLDNQLAMTREEQRHLLDLLINNQSNKMNQIITTLTLFSAIFIPLSFLAGFFGMNFIHFEVLKYEHALLFFIGACVLLATGMILFFKKKKWF